ncbi:mannosyltransferase [Prauserella marina]|uniref:NitT/TauT family transport system ATP-binding protein n=1 Tax=Prauserella marina TaxID=530584 RepID=A0A222VLV6_9PSEU|nr:ABC transporter ATP-binding protein [Prauserella marina]ASR34906.1 mannosyltransferase [Prauserella marina]PWV85387.1 NitT/TauT family transport system ATP-binding protein [Prauserella marina]SDC56031.1 NitT/TauT family transport system ATP-binding protein [Prauserella marina]
MGDSDVTAVELRSVTMSYRARDGDYTAVSDVDLSVERGRFVSVVGPTGCGKSTLLNAVAGLLPPSSGSVHIDGTPLRGLNRKAGYLFQQDALLPWKTVLDNVAFGLELRGTGKQERTELARDWIKRVGLAGFENAYPHQLSGGMRKRTAVAQSWIGDPPMLLMDEPFGALDVQTRQVMENELLTLWTGSEKTVLFVTHDLDEAISLSDEVVLLSAGPGSTIVGSYQVDLPRPRNLLDIRTEPAFTEIYRAIWSDLRNEVMKTYERIAAGQAG